MAQQHSLIQAPIGQEINGEGPRQAGCSCTGGMVAVYSARKAYANHQDHLQAQGLSQMETDCLLDKAWETLTGKKD